jgi:hypothetical protein
MDIYHLKFKKAIFLLLSSFILSCSNDDPNCEKPFSVDPKLANTMYFTGSAIGMDEGFDINCQCDLILEIDSFEALDNGIQYFTGNMGGGISRTVLDENGDGISLSPDLFGKVNLVVGIDGRVTILWNGNMFTGSRFYNEIAIFVGFLNEEGNVSGPWRCAPFDINEGGYVDIAGTVEGVWELTKGN